MTTPDAINDLMRLSEAATQDWRLPDVCGCTIAVGGQFHEYTKGLAQSQILSGLNAADIELAVAVVGFIRSPAFAEMAKDRERLDWQLANSHMLVFEKLDAGWWVYDNRLGVNVIRRAATARAAIDSAIDRERGNGS